MVIWRDACGGDVEDSMSELEKPMQKRNSCVLKSNSSLLHSHLH